MEVDRNFKIKNKSPVKGLAPIDQYSYFFQTVNLTKKEKKNLKKITTTIIIPKMSVVLYNFFYINFDMTVNPYQCFEL